MASYINGEFVYGDEEMLGKFLPGLMKVVKKTPIGAAVKFIAHPIKETKAAVTTIARFDPTSSTAKYGKATRTGLLVAAAIGAGVLTAGVGTAAIGGALGVSAGTAGLIGTGAAAGIGIGAKAIGAKAQGRQDERKLSEQMAATAQPLVNVPPTTGEKPPPKKSPTPMIAAAGIGLVVLAGLYFATQK
jgi:hypothetical protein